MSKILKVKACAKIELGNGIYTFADVWFHISGENPIAIWRKCCNAAKVSFSAEQFDYVGESYEVTTHDTIKFMGINFDANTIKEVNHFPNNNTICITTKDDNYSIGYGHIYPISERERVIDDLFTVLHIKKVRLD